MCNKTYMSTYTIIDNNDLQWVCAFLRSYIINIEDSQRPLSIEYIERLAVADADNMMLREMQRTSTGRQYVLEDIRNDPFTNILRTVIESLSTQNDHQPVDDIRNRMIAEIDRTQPRTAPPGPQGSVDEYHYPGANSSADDVDVLAGPSMSLDILLSRLYSLVLSI